MKTILKLMVLLFCAHVAALAQVAPAATGRTEPILVNELQYALRYSQSGQFSAAYSSMQNSTVSGDVFYVNHSDRHPFTMDYGGGYTWTLSGPDYASGQSHRMFLSQGFDWRKARITVTDNVSYLPQSPTVGFLGIPGTGEPIGTSNPTSSTSQTVLTTNTHAVSNEAHGEIERELSSATEIGASADYDLLRYPDNNGLDTTTKMASALWSHRLNGRNTVTGRYQYSQFSYPTSAVTISTQVALLGFNRRWTRNFTTNLSAGPQWVNSSYTTVVPRSSNVAVNAQGNYRKRLSQFGVGYTRATNGGSGYFIGGEVDVVQGNFTHDFGTNWTLGLSGGYQHTTGLSVLNNGSTKGSFGGAEATWRINRELIAFMSYTAMNQSSTATLPSNAINYLVQNVSFGVGFSPRRANLR